MNKKAPLVSLLTPCYNSEAYIERMLKSVLEQTYSNIELICIDDGSSDGTREIIERYIHLFEIEEKELIYLKREHGGQAAAINAGLKIMRGKYFGLIDSDDFLSNDSVEKRVCALEANPEYSVVASDYFIVNEGDLQTIIGRGNDYIGNLCYQPYQFCLTLIGYSTVTPVGYMIRTDDMRKINPEMNIHECREGQNYQILLPMYYYYKRMYIDEPLAYYVIRNDSHSHMARTREQERERNLNLLNMLEDIFYKLGLPESEIQKYKKLSSFNKSLEDA